MSDMRASKATELGKTCATCDWLEVDTHSPAWDVYEIAIECGKFDVEWHTDLSPHKGTEYEAGLSWCPDWVSERQQAQGDE